MEDDEGIRELMEVILEGQGYEVGAFPNVESFKAGIGEEQPDLLIMDVWLPDGDGRNVCQQLRSQAATANIPILMMTAQYDLPRIEGASDFIPKPFDINDLLGRVQKLLAVQA